MPAAVASTGTSREARRRRILERGSDRLALITGRIQSLPPDPEQYPSQASIPGQTADSARHEDNIVSDSSLMNHESGKEPNRCHILDETDEPTPFNCDKTENISSTEAGESLALDGDKGRNTSSGETEEPSTLNGNKQNGITSRAAALLGVEKELSQISSSARSPAQDHQRIKTLRNSHRTGQIRSAIAATENIRICSSAAVAILVILSYTGSPILGSSCMKTIILLKPVFLLLLTNISIILAHHITRGADSRVQQASRASGIGKAIEVGLMLQHMITAVSMDFGIYAILLVCGCSLLQRLW